MSAFASDVVIVGGGIMGASAAFFLRRRGRSVTLLERGLIGQQASGTNFGNVRRQGRPLYELPLSNRASATWRRARELLGADVEYLQLGHMRVCFAHRPEYVERLEQYARDALPLGLRLEILDRAALRERFPFLGPDVLAGSLSPDDGHANPRLAAPAFARAAARGGAHVVENVAIEHATKSGEDFVVAAADGREFRAPVLVVAAGAWSDRLSSGFGEPVPLVTRAPTMSVTEPLPYAIGPSIGVSTPLEVESVYFRQIPRGNVIIGGSTRGQSWTDERRAPVVPENTLTQFREMRRLAPALARAQIIRVWSGVESYPPDDTPVIGPSGRVPGLYYAFGFAGSGFQIGPGVGETLAELVDTGATPLDLSPYRIGRFAAPRAD